MALLLPRSASKTPGCCIENKHKTMRRKEKKANGLGPGTQGRARWSVLFCLFACLFIRLLSLCCLMWLVSILPVSSSGIVSSIPSILMLSPFTELILVIELFSSNFPN